MELHTGVFSMLLRFPRIYEDLSPAFGGPKRKWWCLETQFNQPRQSGDLFFVCCFVLFYLFIYLFI